MTTLAISVVVPAYKRAEQAARLLGQLAKQTFPPDRFEVIVVDDGSPEPLAPELRKVQAPFALALLARPNGGAGAARHTGAQAAQGELLVFVDDDMEVGPEFLQEHANAQRRWPGAAVQGRIDTDLSPGRPLFDRYHARRMKEFCDALAKGRPLRGPNLCSANISVPRAAYLAAGGFDGHLPRSEDAELGLRLEKAGVRLAYCDQARALHRGSQQTAAQWMETAERYGACELEVSRKHPWATHADPFRYLFRLGAPRAQVLAAAALFPKATRALPFAFIAAGQALDKAGLRRAAVHATGFAYSTQVYRGMGGALGSAREALSACADFLAKAAHDPQEGVPRALSAAARMREDFRGDMEARLKGEAKYSPEGGRKRAAPVLIENIGLQIVLGIRAMRFFKDAGLPLGSRIVSRLIRHAYGCDVHWDAEIAPGLMIAHGMGMAVAAGTKIGPRCILSHGVSVGMGTDPQTRAKGAPTLEADVHIGPGAAIIGPVTIGAGTKIMPGAVVMTSVPARSIVETPKPAVRPRQPLKAVITQMNGAAPELPH